MKITEDFSIQKNKENTVEFFYYDTDGTLTPTKKLRML